MEEIQKTNEYATNGFLEYIYHHTLPEEDFQTCEANRLEAVKKESLERVGQILRLGELKEMLETELSWELRETFETDGIQVDKFAVWGIRALCFPVYMVRPKVSNQKAVLYLHGHDPLGARAAVSRMQEKSYHNWIAIQLAKEGFTVFVPEQLGFGEAVVEGYPDEEDNKGHCYPNAVRLMACGYSLCSIRVLEAVKTMDFAGTMGFNRFGLVGISGGAMVGNFVGLMDERVAASVLSAWANTYVDSTFAVRHCVDNYIPDMVWAGENYHLTACMVPKPLMVMTADWKRGFPIWGARKAFAYLRYVYDCFHASEKLNTWFFDGDALIDDTAAVDWIKCVL